MKPIKCPGGTPTSWEESTEENHSGVEDHPTDGGGLDSGMREHLVAAATKVER